MRRIKLLISSALALSLATLAGVASAEEAAAPAPTPAAARAPASEDGPSDHAKHVGRIGIGYFGPFSVPNNDGALATGGGPSVQVVGVRYWLQEKMAIDLGLGLSMTNGSTTAADGTKSDGPSRLVFALKAGVPISMYEGKHYSFIFEPQLLFGHSGTTTKVLNAADNTSGGNHLAIGATAGAEVSFGFIGLPMLALDATVGLAFDWQNGSSKTGATGDETKASATTLATASGSQPWNIFSTNVAVLYYF
jgi:hypothetical protein